MPSYVPLSRAIMLLRLNLILVWSCFRLRPFDLIYTGEAVLAGSFFVFLEEYDERALEVVKGYPVRRDR